MKNLGTRVAKLEEVILASERIVVRALPPDSDSESYTERDERGNITLWLDAVDMRL